MSSTDESNSKALRAHFCGTIASPDQLAGLLTSDLTRALVMPSIGQFVNDGLAAWSFSVDNEIELRFLTGDIFLLDEASITRFA